MLVLMQQAPRRVARSLAVVGGWVAAASIATAVTLAAVSMIDLGLFGGSTRPLSQADVNDALAEATASASPSTSATPTTPSPDASATSPPSPPASQPPNQPQATEPVPLSAGGNSVLARCVGETVEIISWTAAQGYHVDDGVNQQGREAEVEFESDDSDIKIRVTCATGVPTAEVQQDD